MEYPLDSFFISISDSILALPLSILYAATVFVSTAGFVYYWFKAVFAWFTFVKKVTADGSYWKGTFGLSNPFHPEARPFLAAWFKGVLAWLIGGWPLVLFAFGLVSENAFQGFFR